MYGGVFEIVLFYLILDEREEKSHSIYLGSGPGYVYVWKYIDLEIERTDHKKMFLFTSVEFALLNKKSS